MQRVAVSRGSGSDEEQTLSFTHMLCIFECLKILIKGKSPRKTGTERIEVFACFWQVSVRGVGMGVSVIWVDD